MTSWLWFLICIVASSMLGLIYLTYLLRKTRSITNQHCSLVWSSHGIIRFGVLISCFYLLSGHNWLNWIACLIGWTSIKILVLSQVRRQLNLTRRGIA